jgi:hypothetical protein
LSIERFIAAADPDRHEPPEARRDNVRRGGALARPPFTGADALEVRGAPAVEILSETSYRMHSLTPLARAEGGRITYPPEQPNLL